MFSKAKEAPAADAPRIEDPLVAQARTQARRRLIGAGVLLAIGVVAFPLVFDTQPRPLPQDWRVVAASSAATGGVAPRPLVGTPGATEGGRQLTPANLPEDAGIETPQAASAPKTAAPAPVASAPAAQAAPAPAAQAPAARTPPVPAARTAPVAATPTAASASAPAPAAAGPRFVVQAGAYTDSATLRSARQRVEGLGLKTYTQEVENAQGKRTRVRVGPFATREEAEAAARRIKATGLQASVLTL